MSLAVLDTAKTQRQHFAPRAGNPGLMASVSHELRTPLGAVLGFAHLMEMDESEPLTASQRRRVELIGQAGRHMLGIITDMLSAPAVHSGKDPVSGNKEVELAPLMHEVMQWMQPSASRQGVDLLSDPIAARVHGDGRCIRQVMLNLVSNATKYNHRGGSVRIRQLPADSDGRIGLSIEDTGCGMSEAMLTHLFTPFDRLGRECSEVEGTGIGLCIAREHIDAMGGRLEVRSEPGVGSVFTIWLREA